MVRAKRWAPRVAAVVFCGALGTVSVTAVAGASAGKQWAVVDATGQFVRGRGETAAARYSTGYYEVTFASPMTKCAYVATPGDTGSTPLDTPVEIAVGAGPSGPDGVAIFAMDSSTGAPVDTPFHLVTYCGKNSNDAVINSDGTMERGSHVTSATQLASGTYAVDFDRNVSKCAYTATMADNNSVGGIAVSSRAGDKKGVVVQAMFRTGGPEDTPFDLAVDCGKGSVNAVVNSDGTTARGTHVVSSKLVSTKGESGRYEVSFNQNVAACGYTANVGEPGSGSISVPVTISTATFEGTTNGVLVFVHNTNGLTRNEPFHLDVTC